ncbi:MAG TPA: 30S ribosomal protein S3, partial [Candidatus Vogelbacteria bacterium]|nr:30S ribosomal protein S3 [Candidatus Vogelbacteria bacterium]
VDMERGEKLYRVIIKTSRPGMIIGRNGEGALKLKDDIIKVLSKTGVALPTEIKVDIEEIKNPEAQAPILAQMAAEALEKRMPFKRVMKQTIEKAMSAKGVQGVKIVLSGRLGGAEMSRKEILKEGRIPLTTLKADVDFAREKAYLPYGVIGIKVWVYRGEIFNDN